jgi:hypothetical protein
MTTENNPSSLPPKHSPASLQKSVRAINPKLHAAVNDVLGQAGLTGVKVHSINFSVDRDAITAPGCEDCDLTTHDCVLTPNGYVCLPTS